MSIPLWMQHYINPLHVYCRLIDIGLSRENALKITCLYEKTIYNFIGNNFNHRSLNLTREECREVLSKNYCDNNYGEVE